MKRRTSLRVALIALVFVAAAAAVACSGPSIRYRYQPRLTAPGSDLRAALSIAGGFQAVDGNQVTFLENGDGSFPAMLAAIHGARSSIHMETYIFRDGEIGRRFVNALVERARAGIKVRLLLDALGSLRFGGDNEKVLKEAGAQVVYFNPFRLSNLRRIHLRTHRKVLIVDGRVGFTGGICIDDAWLGDADLPERWRETQVRVVGPVVLQMQVAFARAWAEATGELLSARSLFNGENAGQIACQLMDSIPGAATNPARVSFLVATSAARKSIDVTNAYFVPDHITREALRNAARRGVRIRLILPSRKTDVKAIRYAGRSYYKDLLESGIEIYEYQPCRLHSKTMVVDGDWASVGSTNIDRRSFAWNYESNINIFDAAFAATMEAMFERDLAKSTRVTLEEWKRRPFGERVLEKMYGIFRWSY